MIARITLIVVMATSVPVTTPKPIVLHERGMIEQMICAEYTVPSAPRQPNRSCVEASRVRQWILTNGPQPETP